MPGATLGGRLARTSPVSTHAASSTTHPALLISLTASLLGCPVDQLSADDEFGDPPAEGDTFDPTAGSAGSSSSDDADTGDGDGDPPECPDQNKRCDYELTLADMSYQSVDVVGDFAADGWTTGVAMSLRGSTWSATVAMPWDTEVQYKFRINGGEGWIPDPDNPNMVEDGFGGFNSLVEPFTCEDWSCDPGNIGEFDWRDAVIYFVFVDRFYNGDLDNDGPIGVETPADWQGGDWAGVSQKIDEGYFDELGVNTLWLTVPLDNTDDSGVGTDGHDYSAYHGYWPADVNAAEEHFGTLADLQALVELAHSHEIKVILDYAMNHVHISSPVYTQNPGWFWPNDNGQGGNCVCGEGCDWNGEPGKRCWFTSYLPDYNFTVTEAREFSVDNALQWMADTGADGFRLDAVKHIEDQWLLDVRSRVSAEVEAETGEHVYMVGETFTGDRDLIAYYVNPAMLDGQFDFPLRMELTNKLIMRQGSMSDLANFMDSNDDYYGAGIMSTFIGNHDIPRVIHLAEDIPVWDSEWTDGKDLAWSNLPLPQNEAPFQRMALGFTLIMTIPGAPLIYYGDEVGMAGAGDPDNRRFMQWEGYTGGQQLLLDHVKALTAIRAGHQALRRGGRTTLSADLDTLVYEMSSGADVIYVAFNRSDSERTADGLPGGDFEDLLSGQMVSGTSVNLPARTSMILLPQ